MSDQVSTLMCQAKETDDSLGVTWVCVLPMHNDEHHYFEVVTVHPNIPEQE